jgi:hypothetical protein
VRVTIDASFQESHMATSSIRRFLDLGADFDWWWPARTPGPLGVNDHGDPDVTTRLGDTPGPLGVNDHADVNLPRVGSASGARIGQACRLPCGTAIAAGSRTPKPEVLTITVTLVAGGPLTAGTIHAVNDAAVKTPVQWRRGIAYSEHVNVGGSLAWRANNPGNLRTASTKIGEVGGAVGKFAVFATLADGRAAQRALYLDKYGAMKVRDAIDKLTPPSENDTAGYLAGLQRAGVDLDKTVASQIDALMPAVEANEGLIAGTVVQRLP